MILYSHNARVHGDNHILSCDAIVKCLWQYHVIRSLYHIGKYKYNELVTGAASGAKGRVKTWNVTTNTLKLGTTDGTFIPGDVAVGATSGAQYTVDYIESAEFVDKYDKGDEIESEADDIIDFSEGNPFGTF